MSPYYAKCKYTGMFKGEEIIVITSRKEHFKKVTEKWLEDIPVKVKKLYMMKNGINKSTKNMVKHKAKVLRNLDVEKYYEDDLEIAKGLSCLTDVRIVRVDRWKS